MHQKIFVSINDQDLDTTLTDSIKIAQCTSCNIIFQINTTSPKKKHNPKRGVGGKDPKTIFMERQLKVFKQFLAAFNYAGDVKKLNALATQCWHKNKPKWDAATKSSGQLKGYTSPKVLADAYRKFLVKNRIIFSKSESHHVRHTSKIRTSPSHALLPIFMLRNWHLLGCATK